MGDMETSAYRAAKAVWDAAHERVKRMAAEVEQVAQALQHNPLRFMVSNVPDGAPAGLRLSNTIILNGERWPTAETLAKALNELRDAAFTARNAWAALSEQERAREEPAEGALI